MLVAHVRSSSDDLLASISRLLHQHNDSARVRQEDAMATLRRSYLECERGVNAVSALVETKATHMNAAALGHSEAVALASSQAQQAAGAVLSQCHSESKQAGTQLTLLGAYTHNSIDGLVDTLSAAVQSGSAHIKGIVDAQMTYREQFKSTQEAGHTSFLQACGDVVNQAESRYSTQQQDCRKAKTDAEIAHAAAALYVQGAVDATQAASGTVAEFVLGRLMEEPVRHSIHSQ